MSQVKKQTTYDKKLYFPFRYNEYKTMNEDHIFIIFIILTFK